MSGVSTVHNPYGIPGTNRLLDRWTTDDVVPIRLTPNMDKEEYATGKIRPTTITAEQAFSCNLLVDHRDAIYSANTPFNFTVDFTSDMIRARIGTVQRVILPLINNVNPLNNTIQFSIHFQNNLPPPNDIDKVVSFSCILQPAVYDTASLCNEIAANMNAAVSTDPDIDWEFSCNFSAVTQSFTIELSPIAGATSTATFNLWEECTFVSRGKYLCGFTGLPAITSSANFYQKIRSGRAGMVYTRFVTIHSQRLTENTYQKSKTSDQQQGTDIIAIVDVTGIYNSGNFDTGIPFSGVYKVIETPEAPKINLMNGAQKLTRYVDFYSKDEYGFGLDTCMENLITNGFAAESDDPVLTRNTPNTLGMSLWLEIFF